MAADKRPWLCHCPVDVQFWPMLSKKSAFCCDRPGLPGIENGGQCGRGSRLILLKISRNRPAREHGGWTEGSKRKGFQVLYDGREMKFVTRTG